MSFENILYAVENGVARVTVHRPDKMNALNHRTITELGEAFDAARDDDAVRALVLTGSGEKAFVAGADIGELLEQAGSAQGATDLAAFGQDVFRKLEHLGKPSIAMINGFALGGGCELALACTYDSREVDCRRVLSAQPIRRYSSLSLPTRCPWLY
ncbi:MAG: enoyl-CoA hydratase-related protein [Planctomycetota bacterium]